eukprot:1078815-Rhodomonas_salina.1
MEVACDETGSHAKRGGKSAEQDRKGKPERASRKASGWPPMRAKGNPHTGWAGGVSRADGSDSGEAEGYVSVSEDLDRDPASQDEARFGLKLTCAAVDEYRAYTANERSGFRRRPSASGNMGGRGQKGDGGSGLGVDHPEDSSACLGEGDSERRAPHEATCRLRGCESPLAIGWNRDGRPRDNLCARHEREFREDKGGTKARVSPTVATEKKRKGPAPAAGTVAHGTEGRAVCRKAGCERQVFVDIAGGYGDEDRARPRCALPDCDQPVFSYIAPGVLGLPGGGAASEPAKPRDSGT